MGEKMENEMQDEEKLAIIMAVARLRTLQDHAECRTPRITKNNRLLLAEDLKLVLDHIEYA